MPSSSPTRPHRECSYKRVQWSCTPRSRERFKYVGDLRATKHASWHSTDHTSRKPRELIASVRREPEHQLLHSPGSFLRCNRIICPSSTMSYSCDWPRSPRSNQNRNERATHPNPPPFRVRSIAQALDDVSDAVLRQLRARLPHLHHRCDAGRISVVATGARCRASFARNTARLTRALQVAH